MENKPYLLRFIIFTTLLILCFPLAVGYIIYLMVEDGEFRRRDLRDIGVHSEKDTSQRPAGH
jgi:hypothetical protein